ncbi:MAG: ABC transporter ATP-binding protein/permease [Bacilli bacterium]|nr:ABC transporter ATP-binding protein/permease [Bacilli bacterium]
MIRAIRKFIKFTSEKNRKYLYIAIFLGIIYALSDVMKIASVYLILDGFFNNALDAARIWLAFGLLAGGIVVMIICKYAMTMLQCIAGYTTGANKRLEIAEHLRYMPMGYYNKNSLGFITSVATNTMENLNDIATRVIMMVTDGVLDSLLIMALMFFFDWRMGLIVLGVFICFLLVQMAHQAIGRKLAPIKDKADENLVEDVLEYCEGITEVKNYNLVKQASSKIYDSIEKHRKINTRMELNFSQFDIYEGIFMKLGTVAMGLLSIFLYLNGQMTLPVVIVTIIASFLVFNGLARACGYSSLLKNVEVCVDKGNKILAEPVMNTKGDFIRPGNHDISVKNISFSYEEKEIIKDVSFDIKENTKVALVGPSGSGKSTLAKLISRFFDVNKGSIYLGGRNIKDYNIDSLMRNFSFVFQNVYLFSDTIRNNIKIGKSDATDEEMIEACKKAKCHDFIMSLPEGYDTVLAEGGSSLSGGERQRLSIARAILKDAPIIILDEATANIDPENENLIIEAFNELTKDKTILMIAHRLKTVRNADDILVLDDGKIVDEGTHDELMKHNGLYAKFVNERQEAIGFKL